MSEINLQDLCEKLKRLTPEQQQTIATLLDHIDSPECNDHRWEVIALLNQLSDEQCHKFLPSLVKLLGLTQPETKQSILLEIEEEMYLISRFFRSYLPLP